MIIGIGSDLIDITRVAKVIERHGERFLDRIFTPAERAEVACRALGVANHGCLGGDVVGKARERGAVGQHGA
ncbi:4'-phosphopantetheinyl transferase superfamily protein, partial [Bradyrhizobium sp. SHOUNA76]